MVQFLPEAKDFGVSLNQIYELCMDLEVVVDNRIRFFGHKVDLNSFDDLEEIGLRKDGENLYKIRQENPFIFSGWDELP